MTLDELTDEELNSLLSMEEEAKLAYFTSMIKNYFPDIEENSEKYAEILESYISSFYTEKLYRTNRFFNEKFTIVYTDRGLIRNIIADMYYNDKDLIVH